MKAFIAFTWVVCHALMCRGAATVPRGGDDCTDEAGLLQLSTRNRLSAFEAVVHSVHRFDGGAGVPSTLGGTEAAVKTLAQNVVNGKTSGLNDTELVALQGIKDFLHGILDSIATDHDEDQDEVDRARDDFNHCTNTSNHSELLDAVRNSKRAEHSECRGQQSILNGTQKTECQNYNNNVKNQPLPPSCMASYSPPASEAEVPDAHVCLIEMTNWAVPLNASLADLKQKCDVATTDLNDKVDICDLEQSEYETSVCEFKSAKEEICSTYATCRSDAISEQGTVQAAVNVSEAGRKAAFVSAHRILCYLEIFNLTAADQPDKLQSCSEEVHDASGLNITYYEPRQQLVCLVGDYPCQEEWLNENYYGSDCYLTARLKQCVPCTSPSPGGGLVRS